MQGESDASKAKSSIYKEAMAGVIKQLRDDMKCPGMSVVIGRISDCHKGKPDWDAVRKAQEDVAAEDPLTVWVDTDDLNDGVNKKTGKKFDRGLHYTRDGYDELGRRFAAESVKLLQTK